MHEFCFNLVWLICVFLCSSVANFFLLFSVPPCLRGECIFISAHLRQLFLLFSASPRLRGEFLHLPTHSQHHQPLHNRHRQWAFVQRLVVEALEIELSSQRFLITIAEVD